MFYKLYFPNLVWAEAVFFHPNFDGYYTKII
jgi:hypothetical protein